MKLSKEEVEKRTRLLKTPLDLAALEQSGVLAKDGAWYRILDPERVPEALWLWIGEMRVVEGGASFRFPGREDSADGSPEDGGKDP